MAVEFRGLRVYKVMVVLSEFPILHKSRQAPLTHVRGSAPAEQFNQLKQHLLSS